MFTTTNDLFGPYFLFAPRHTFVRNVSNAAGGDVISFLDRALRVSGTLREDSFATNLVGPNVDQIIIPLLSLLIILLIESLAATFLLVTHDRKVWSFGFSVNQFIDLVRDYRFNHIRTRFLSPGKRLYELKVALTAVAILLFTIAAQITVLWLSASRSHDVTNAEKSFQLLQPIHPDWNAVRNSSTFLINKPCLSVVITNVGRSLSSINNCLTSTLSANAFEPFNIISDNSSISVTITSDLHVYGADHILNIDGTSVEYVARSYIVLDDFETRITKQRARFNKQERQMYVVHKQFLAYLFTSYLRMTGDTAMNLDRLRALKFQHMPIANGSVINVVQTNNGSTIFRTSSIRYETQVRGVIPRGTAAFRFAQSFFKAIIGIEVSAADESDLIANEGVQTLHGVMWAEGRRYLNWLSSVVTATALFAMLILLRWYLHPTDMAHMAAAALHKTGTTGMLAVETEAVIDDGVEELEEMEGGSEKRGETRSAREFWLGAGANQRSYLGQEYQFGQERDTG